MEKLQQALQKARQQRGAQEPRPAAAPHRRATEGTDEVWAGLRSFEPDEKTLKRHRVVSYNVARNSTPLDMLRTKMLLHMRKNNWRRMAVTSATADCGKTTMLCNIALGMTRQPGVRTVLFDFDLRNPSIAEILGAEPTHDVTEMLTGAVSFEDQALRIRDNLAVCMATRRTADPMRFLMGPDIWERLEEIERRLKPDVMLFDLPPLVVGGETAGFLTNVDCAMIVARAEKTTFDQIDRSEREIAEHTNVLGVVLNQCRFGDLTADYYKYGV
jgi:protein-tyrosine kinase